MSTPHTFFFYMYDKNSPDSRKVIIFPCVVYIVQIKFVKVFFKFYFLSFQFLFNFFQFTFKKCDHQRKGTIACQVELSMHSYVEI